MFKQLPKIFRKFAKGLAMSPFLSGHNSFGHALSDNKSIIFNAYKLDGLDGDDNWLSITDIENGTTIKLTHDEMMSLCSALFHISNLHDDFNNEVLKK